jgi:hypothetical protein
MARRDQIHVVPEQPPLTRARFERAVDGAAALRPGQLSEANLDAARMLAEVHYEVAAELEPDSPVRALALRCANHWSRLGRLPRNGLRPSPPPR